MAIQVKERESFTPEMLDYLERTKKVVDEHFLPYRVVFNLTPWLTLRQTMPDKINNLFKAIMDNHLMGAVIPKQYG